MPCSQLWKRPHQDRKHKDIADTHTFWVADILVVSIDTTTNGDLGRPPSLSSHHPLGRIQHSISFVSCLWHKGLHIWRIKVNSFCLRRVPVQATERILLVDLAAIQRKLLALQRGVSDSNTYNPASMKQIIWSIWRRSRSCNLAPRRERWGLGNGEGSSRELWKWCYRELGMPSHPFSSTTPPCSSSGWPQFLHQLINIIVLDPFVCYSRKPFLTEGLIRLDTDQKIK